MTKKQKKELRELQSTRQLMGISQLTGHGLHTAAGELAFFLVQPDNLSVLSEEGVRSRVVALTNLLRGLEEVRLMALDSRESFQNNKRHYQARLEQEELPAIRELLRCDCGHLDEIQSATASAREVALVFRLDKGGRGCRRPAAPAGEAHPGPGVPGPAGGKSGHDAPAGGLLRPGHRYGIF